MQKSNDYEITITDNRLKWLKKAERCGKHDESMYHITHKVEEWGVAWSFFMKPEFCYPAILGGKSCKN